MGKFPKYLGLNECYELLKRNKVCFHIETGNIFFDNVNSEESILDFIAAQQDYDKKLLQIEFNYSVDYDNYVFKYLMAIKSENDDKYDILTNKNSKFLFYNFNVYLYRRGLPVQYLRHTIVS